MKTLPQIIRKPLSSGKWNHILVGILLLYSADGYSCINCNQDVRQAISSSFCNNPLLLLGFIILTVVVTGLSVIALKKPNPYLKNITGMFYSPKAPLTAASMVLGIGIGGFIDGIVLHQILQWHEMLSNKITPVTLISKSVNMFWDGIFHLFTLLVTITGIYLLWKVLQQKQLSKDYRLLIGGMLLGWAIFNLLEGILNHHILKLHNVREISNSPDWWNFGFLFFSIVLLLVGILQISRPLPSNHSDIVSY
jgi:uncharacterized membrane protein